MVTSEPPVSETEKREALNAVLSSVTFERSAQLRAFLRYVCEMELTGHSELLSEYSIAVEVLGRRKDVDLTDDSSVRNRAYELRGRLEKYYTAEEPRAPVRIDIPRGGYAPAFVRQSVKIEPAILPASLPPNEPAPARRTSWIAALAASVLFGAAGWIAGSSGRTPRPPAILAEAWGPMADSGGDMLICIATSMHMLIRPHIPPRATRAAVPKELYPLYTPSRPLEDSDTLYMEPAQLSIPLAELSAAATLASVRTAFGGSYQILPESEAPITALLGRNGVLIGTPVNSRAATALLRTVPLTIGFTPADEFAVIDQRKPVGEGVLYKAQPVIEPKPRVLYGLLTVLTATDTSGKPRRTIELTGTGSAGVQGAAEFFSSAARMLELKQRLGAEGVSGFPPNYQVVVRCTTSGLRLVRYEYVAHVIVESPLEPTP